MYTPAKLTTISHFTFINFNKVCVPVISIPCSFPTSPFSEESVLLVYDFILSAHRSISNNLKYYVVIYLISK